MVSLRQTRINLYKNARKFEHLGLQSHKLETEKNEMNVDKPFADDDIVLYKKK